jgi:hypothetical protein
MVLNFEKRLLMSRILYGQSSGGPIRRFRGRKWLVRQKLTKRQTVQVLVFLVFLIIVLVFGMYLGWWTLLNEERDAESSALFPVESERASFALITHRFIPSLEQHEKQDFFFSTR